MSAAVDQVGIEGDARPRQRIAVALRAQPRRHHRRAQREIADPPVTRPRSVARPEGAGPARSSGSDGGRADVVEAVDEHQRALGTARRQRHLAVIVGDVDQPFDPVLEEGAHQRRDPFRSPPVSAIIRVLPLSPMACWMPWHDEQSGRPALVRLVVIGDRPGDQADQTGPLERIIRAALDGHIAELHDGALDRLRVSASTGASPFSTRLTVLGDTPAALATS